MVLMHIKETYCCLTLTIFSFSYKLSYHFVDLVDIFIPNKLAQTVTFLTCNREVSISISAQTLTTHIEFFRFYSVLLENFESLSLSLYLQLPFFYHLIVPLWFVSIIDNVAK
jgi:hypothetical protein